MRPSQRIRLLVAIAALVALGIVGDNLVGSGGRPVAGGVASGSSFVAVHRGPTTLAPVSAVSSSWYCEVATTALAAASAPTSSTSTGSTPTTTAGAKSTTAGAESTTAGAKSTPASKSTAKSTAKSPASKSPAATPAGPAATAAIALANTGPAAVGGTVSLVGEGGSTGSVTVSVPAHGKAQVDEGSLVKGPDVAATVVLDGGGVAVEQLMTVGKTLTVSPCASSSSASWYFAAGSTTGSNQLLIALYNPLATSAVADLSFATNAGPATPSDDQNVVVPSMSQVVLDVAAHVQQRSLVATTVSVRDGRLVANEVQSEAVSGHSDFTVALGATATGSVWDFPSGLDEKGATEQLDIYNPSSSAADLQIGLDLSYGSAVPISMSVPAGSAVEVATADQKRIPIDSLFGVQIETTNEQGIVVERSFLDSPPQAQVGLTDATGGVPAKSWVLATGAPVGSVSDRVVVENPGKAQVRLSVTAMSGGAAEPAPVLSNQLLNPGRPETLALSPAQLAYPLVVSASAPVVVEQDLVGPGGQGISSVLAEPAG